MSMTPLVPFEIYVKDATGKFSTPTPLASLIKSGITLDPTTGQMVVAAPTGTTITSLVNDSANHLTLSYVDAAGNPQTLTANVVTGNTLAISADGKSLTSTVNGVVSNILDISALVADINVDTVAWDAATYTLKLTETDGTVHTLNLASLVAVSVADSITGDGTTAAPLRLVNDLTAPGNLKYYGTDAAGVKGWYSVPGSGVAISTGTVTAKVIEDIPLEGYGDETKMLWGPNKWIALTDNTGAPLLGSNGKSLVVPAYELP